MYMITYIQSLQKLYKKRKHVKMKKGEALKLKKIEAQERTTPRQPGIKLTEAINMDSNELQFKRKITPNIFMMKLYGNKKVNETSLHRKLVYKKFFNVGTKKESNFFYKTQSVFSKAKRDRNFMKWLLFNIVLGQNSIAKKSDEEVKFLNLNWSWADEYNCRFISLIDSVKAFTAALSLQRGKSSTLMRNVALMSNVEQTKIWFNLYVYTCGIQRKLAKSSAKIVNKGLQVFLIWREIKKLRCRLGSFMSRTIEALRLSKLENRKTKLKTQMRKKKKMKVKKKNTKKKTIKKLLKKLKLADNLKNKTEKIKERAK